MMRFTTRAIHEGELIDALGAVSTPIYQTSNFKMDDDKYQHFHRDCYTYTRCTNPTTRVVEKKLASLCQAHDGVLLSSGIAAISATLLSFTNPGDNILFPSKMYGGTFNLINNHLLSAGIEVRIYCCQDIKEAQSKIDEKTRILYAEPLTNPTLEIMDIQGLSAIKGQALLVVDNTFLSPYNFLSLNCGADIELHSVTKYICGHSDVIAGYMCAKDPSLVEKVWTKSVALGFTPGPFDAFLISRGVKTLGLRMERHNANAEQIARWLSDTCQDIVHIRHPSLFKEVPSCFDNIPGFGGIVYADFLTLERAKSFVRALKIFLEATSLAGIESLVTIPCLTSHSTLSGEELRKAGMSPGGVRLSVGIEDIEDLMEDIQRGLKAAGICQ